jgi:hypothetical protein
MRILRVRCDFFEVVLAPLLSIIVVKRLKKTVGNAEGSISSITGTMSHKSASLRCLQETLD